MNITRNNNKDKQLVVMHKTLHHIAGKRIAISKIAVAEEGGSLDCAGGHGVVGRIDVVVVMVIM
jgi:hypothetical protein